MVQLDSELTNITGYGEQDQKKEEEQILDPDDFLMEEEEEKDISENGLVRGGFLAIIVLLLLGLGGFIWWIFSASSSINGKVPNLESEKVVEVKDDQELGSLKAELALRDQQLPETPAPKKQLVKPEEKKSPPPPKIKPKSTPRKVVTRQPVVRQQSVVRPQPVQRVVKTKKEDSLKRWQELAQIGVYKSQQKAQELPLLENNSKSSPSSTVLASNRVMVTNGASLPPQKAIALLEGGIAIPTRTRTSQKLTVPLVLSEPLVDGSEQEVVPAGATIIAEVTSNGSVMQFTPKTLTFERGEQYYELNLSQGAVIITGYSGPIIASTKTVGQDGEGLSLTQIGQLTTAAGGLAGIKGASEVSLILNALGGRRTSNSSNGGIELYTVSEGTEVVVRIVRNLPFSTGGNSRLNIPSQTSYKSPELDFEQGYVEKQEEQLDFEY